MVIMYTQEGESKYHVANILSSMANGGLPSIITTYAIPSSAYSSITGSSPINALTPTTLNNLEQTFIELQSVQSNSQPTTTSNHITQSGFIPPVVSSAHSTDNDYSYMSDSCSSNDSYLPSEPKKIRIGDKTTTIMSKYEIENPQRKTHRRQLRDEEQISPEEAARRNMRRERNKVAAAKCRQRRVDHTNRLLNETDKLEQEQQAIENEIQSLKAERDQLEFILQAHSPLCKAGRNGHNNPTIKIKAEPDEEMKKNQLCKAATTKELNLTSRPSTLSLIKREMKLDPSSGISITTPSSGFYSFSLDTMVDHTGLTPLTGHSGLTPLTSMPSSCSTEVSKKNSSSSSENSESVKTPSSLLTL